MSNFYLKVQHVEKLCTFELSWGKGQHLSVKTAYPGNLVMLYQVWQRSYLNYYSTLSLPTSTRGQIVDAGVVKAPILDLHAKLVQAEAQLLSEFYKWLRCAELYEIRAVIASVASAESKGEVTINVFLTCDTLELERLPWEAWEIGTEFALGSGKIRISRTSFNIRKAIEHKNSTIQRKVKFLAILGDDKGLDFEAEKKAIGELKHIADVTFVGWQKEKNIQDLKNEIKDAITCSKGWDILFFAGHSNETNLTGGEIGIAPNVALSIREIAPLLSTAIEKGLKFAIFNSCNGLNIANSLIDLGMSQVAVMREPIHNNVAVEFLLQFLKSFTQYKDVHEATLSAAQYLKTDKNLTYPGAYLIPSLFRHPNAELLRIQPFGINAKLKKLIPGAKELIFVLVIAIISSNILVKNKLLETRLLLQTVYRQSTSQLQKQPTPPVLLVQIDNESRSKALSLLPNIKPIGHEYMAQLINKLTAMNAKVVGIDYILDSQQGKSDIILSNALKAAVKSRSNTWFTFAQTYDKNNELIGVQSKIAESNWILKGEIEILPWYMQLSDSSGRLNSNSQFSTLLAVSHQLKTSKQKPPLQIDLKSNKDVWQQINSSITGHPKQEAILNLPRTRLQPITQISQIFNQMWLHPIIDFSIPLQEVYQPISAWQLLEGKGVNLSRVQDQVVIIASGGYGKAGVFADGEDIFELPPAIKYWRLQQSQQENPHSDSPILTGGEAHAYMVHHLLNNRLVIPIPDLWMVGVAIFLGKCLSIYIQENVRYRWRWFALLGLCTAIYGILSLQIYITAVAILLPWLLPTLTVWTYVTPALIKKKSQ